MLPKELQKTIDIVSQGHELYSERKKRMMNKVNIFIQGVVKAANHGISQKEIHELYQLLPREIIEKLKGNTVLDAEKRAKQWAYALSKGEMESTDLAYTTLVKPQQNIS